MANFQLPQIWLSFKFLSESNERPDLAHSSESVIAWRGIQAEAVQRAGFLAQSLSNIYLLHGLPSLDYLCEFDAHLLPRSLALLWVIPPLRHAFSPVNRMPFRSLGWCLIAYIDDPNPLALYWDILACGLESREFIVPLENGILWETVRWMS
jgi:hypothetical protein